MKKLVLFILALGMQTQAWALGNEIANGGDTVSAEFIANGQMVRDNWKKLKLVPGMPLNLKKSFADAVEKTIVESRDSVDIDGRVVDAVNVPSQNKIIVNRQRWLQIKPYDRLVLAFHEYVGLISSVDKNFQISVTAVEPLRELVAEKNGSVFGLDKETQDAVVMVRCSGFNDSGKTLAVEVYLDVMDKILRVSASYDGQLSVFDKSQFKNFSVFLSYSQNEMSVFGLKRWNGDSLDTTTNITWVRDNPELSFMRLHTTPGTEVKGYFICRAIENKDR